MRVYFYMSGVGECSDYLKYNNSDSLDSIRYVSYIRSFYNFNAFICIF